MLKRKQLLLFYIKHPLNKIDIEKSNQKMLQVFSILIHENLEWWFRKSIFILSHLFYFGLY